VANGICAGCGEDTYLKARGYCRACYQQWKRTGSVERHRMVRGQCTVEGCDKPAHGRGLCQMHHKRMRVSGSFDDPRADNVNLKSNQSLYSVWASYRRKDGYPIVPEWYEDYFVFEAGVGERPSAKHRLYRLRMNEPMGPGNFEWRERLVERRQDETDEEYNARHRYARRTVYGTGMWNSDLRNKYGADFDLRKLQAMAAEQDHKCAICGNPETELRNGMVRHLAVDHDHATGKIRQLLCQRCNKGIGAFNDDTDLMALAIAYLVKHREKA
jgi:hypothetical protein